MSEAAANDESPIVLIHGAWGSAATWGPLVALLRAGDRRVIAIDLPGHGADPTPPGEVGLDDYAARVAQVLDGDAPALLVGHSMGGMVISAAADLVPEAVRKLVYVSAFLPRDGQSLLDLIKQQQGAPDLRPAIRPAGVPGASMIDSDAAAAILFQDATPVQRAAARATFGAQPDRAQTDKIRLDDARFGRIPRAYVHCRDDRTVTPDLQRMMVAASPCGAEVTLDGGHFPQLTRPAELAAILTRL